MVRPVGASLWPKRRTEPLLTGVSLVLLMAIATLLPATARATSSAPDSCVQMITTQTADEFAAAELLLPPGAEQLQPVGMNMTGCTWTGANLQVTIGYEMVEPAERAGLESTLDGFDYERHPHPTGSLFGSGGYVYLITDTHHIWVDGTWWDESDPQFATTPLELASETLSILLGELAPATEEPAVTPPDLPTTEGPLDCLEMLPAPTIDGIEDAGYRLNRWTDPEEEFLAWGGTGCTWGVPQSDALLWVAYAPIDAAQVVTVQDRLTAEGHVREEADDGSIIYRFEDSGEFTGIGFSSQYLFADDHVFHTGNGSDEVLAELRTQVTGALAAREEQEVAEEIEEIVEPVAEEPAEPADEPIEAAPVEPVEPPAPVEDDPGEFAGTSPSVLSALPTVAEVDLSPGRLATTAGVAVVFVALAGLPGRLIESAVSERLGRLEQIFAPLARPLGSRWQAASGRIRRLPRWQQIALGLVVATILSGFIEPQFGFNAGSVRLFSSLLLGFVAESLLGLLLIAWMLRRRGMAATLEFKAASLVIIALAVLGTRLVGFQPGVVFGLLLVLSGAGALSPRGQLRLTLAELGWVTTLGLGSWIGYSALAGSEGSATAAASMLTVFSVEVLSGMTIGCLAALPLVLLPLPGLPGAALLRSNPWHWVGGFAVAMALFITIIIPLPESWQVVDMPFATWTVLFIAYAVVALAIWAVLTFLVTDPVSDGATTEASTDEDDATDEDEATTPEPSPADH